jgi:hypothetical protein
VFGVWYFVFLVGYDNSKFCVNDSKKTASNISN